MFTGIIQQTGKVISIQSDDKRGARLVLSDLVVSMPRSFSKGVLSGESMAVDGCCLTVTDKSPPSPRPSPARGEGIVKFDLSEETIRKTTIRYYKKGTVVNLERALKAGDRLGGHFVLGHVDGVGKIKAIKRHRGSLEIRIGLPAGAHGPSSVPIIDKGSVAVDGISLTICKPTRNAFSVFIVPHTEKMTNICFKRLGDLVNLEGDLLGKYVLRHFPIASSRDIY